MFDCGWPAPFHAGRTRPHGTSRLRYLQLKKIWQQPCIGYYKRSALESPLPERELLERFAALSSATRIPQPRE